MTIGTFLQYKSAQVFGLVKMFTVEMAPRLLQHGTLPLDMRKFYLLQITMEKLPDFELAGPFPNA